MAELGVGSARLDDRVAFITGAASGIGRAMALEFAARGARVVACDIVGAGALAVRSEALEAGAAKAIAVTADVADAREVGRAVTEATDAMGRIDILCSNAGILDGYASASIAEA